MSHNGTFNIYLKALHTVKPNTHTHTNSSIFLRFLPPAKFIAEDFRYVYLVLLLLRSCYCLELITFITLYSLMAIYVPSRRASRTTQNVYTRLLFCFELLIACINYLYIYATIHSRKKCVLCTALTVQRQQTLTIRTLQL